jgi:hypothetical protein
MHLTAGMSVQQRRHLSKGAPGVGNLNPARRKVWRDRSFRENSLSATEEGFRDKVVSVGLAASEGNKNTTGLARFSNAGNVTYFKVFTANATGNGGCYGM